MRLSFLCLLFFSASSVITNADGTSSTEPSRISLEKNWHVQSSCKLRDGGEQISRVGYKISGWLATTVPHTVLGAQIDAKLFPDPFYGMNLRAIPGMTYPIGKIFSNMPMPDDSPYKCSWWYRTEVSLPAHLKDKNSWLHFDGINYRANIWVNGKQIANVDQVAGAYRLYEFDVRNALRPGSSNAVAVEIFAPTETDLGINFVDWNPMPADKAMGLWRPVYLTFGGPVSVRWPAVSTRFTDDTLKTAELTVTGELRNATEQPMSGIAEVVLEGVGRLSQQVTLAANEQRSVVFAPEDYPKLRLENPKLWWPYPLGEQTLYKVEMRFVANGESSDAAAAKFGIREITDEKNPNGYELLRINHHNILIRGGGWAPDMFLRTDTQRIENEMRHVRNLGLNTIRLEGKLETDEFFDLADRYGILVMAGWCCCDHWEHWDKWTAADHNISKASQSSQILRLRSHPSMLVWLNGSDNPPPADVESDYISILKQYRWPNPFISSASATPTTVTGQSGVKMTGPYDYVPPSYWLVDPGHWGGAWGFNTETSPGPAPPLLSSIEKFIPKQNLWPHDDVWNFHAGLGSFGQTKIFDDAMAAMYGAPTSLADYERKAQAMTYEGERAMFEAFARNKYNSTGVIQWMLNNAWPSVIWHLYDYYLVPAGGYFGAKKANELVHAQYSYDDRSIVVVNGLYQLQRGLRLRVRVFDLSSNERFNDTKIVDLGPDAVAKLPAIPDIADLSSPFFVRLDLSDAAGKTLSSNFYWVPTQLPELDFEKSNYYTTPATYPDMMALANMPHVKVEYSDTTEHLGSQEYLSVHLRNSGKALALLVHCGLKTGPATTDAPPVLWDDNYVTLLPGESRTVRTPISARDFGASEPQVVVDGWNVSAEKVSKAVR